MIKLKFCWKYCKMKTFSFTNTKMFKKDTVGFT